MAMGQGFIYIWYGTAIENHIAELVGLSVPAGKFTKPKYILEVYDV